MSAFLSAADVERLTGCTRPADQRRHLDAMGIRYVGREEPLVRPEWLDSAGRPAQRSAHRWDMIGNAQITPLTRSR